MAGFAGVLLILHPERDTTPGALVFAGGMAVCFTFYQYLTKMVADESEVTNLFHTAFWVFLLLGPLVLLDWHQPTPLGWADLVAVGLLGFGALLALDVALRLASPALIAPVFYLQPAATRFIAWALHGTQLSSASIVGSLVVVVSMFVSSRASRVATRPAIA
jgi:drug/metabolite transporter (DMT)-like permease